jgi:hypothetical protein
VGCFSPRALKYSAGRGLPAFRVGLLEVGLLEIGVLEVGLLTFFFLCFRPFLTLLKNFLYLIQVNQETAIHACRTRRATVLPHDSRVRGKAIRGSVGCFSPRALKNSAGRGLPAFRVGVLEIGLLEIGVLEIGLLTFFFLCFRPLLTLLKNFL